jgi:hypothetical protein
MEPREPHFLQRLREHRAVDAEGWNVCAGLNFAESEALLDWLEAAGFAQREVVLGETGKVTVRWRE